MNCKQAIKEALAKRGEVGLEEFVDSLSENLDEIAKQSANEAEFRSKAQEYINNDVTGWAIIRKIERQRFLWKLAGAKKFLAQDIKGIGGSASTFEKLYSFVIGGEVRQSEGGNLSTRNAAAGFSALYRSRLRNAWGTEGLRIVESNLLNKEIVQEIANLEAGGTSAVSGSDMAFKLAQDFFNIQQQLFSQKAGYNPRLRQISEYIFRQTHSRERVSAVPFDEWFKFALDRFGEKSFKELPFERMVEQYKRIYDEIISGTHGQTSFNLEAKDSSITYKMAKARTLIPNDWKAFYEYNAQFGKGDIGVTLLNSIDAAARDISVMSKFSATPRALIEALISHAQTIDPKFRDEFEANRQKFNAAFDEATFKHQAQATNIAARAIVGSQKLLAVAQLGAQYLRAFNDFGVAANTIANELGGGGFALRAKLFVDYWRNFAKGTKAAGEIAEQLGVFNEGSLRNMHIEVGGDATEGWLGKLLSLHSKASLADLDKAAKSATIGEVVSNRLAQLAKKPWNELDPNERAGFQRYGIGEVEHSVLKAMIVNINGRDFITPNSALEALEKRINVQATLLGVDPNTIVTLEKSPGVVETASKSIYENPDPAVNAYARTRKLTVAERPKSGVDVGQVSKAYSPESAAETARLVHEVFSGSGYSDAEATVPSVLFSTFFDSVGKHVNKDPLELFQAYGFSINRLPERFMNSLGALIPEYHGGKGKITMLTVKEAMFDKTVIHEGAHFFLEVLRDIRPIIDGAGDSEFKNGINNLFEWLTTDKNGNFTHASHERFANSYEVYLRTNKAPSSSLERVFAAIRDWYRRTLFMVKAGLSNRGAFSLAYPERAPAKVEAFYKLLMGGDGASEHLGDLTSAMETMPQSAIAERYAGPGGVRPIPSKGTDLILKIASIINEHAEIGTTTAGARDRVFMYGGGNINTPHGMLMRLLWQFKSSSVAQFNAMRRGFYSNPSRPQGDFSKVAWFATEAMALWTIQDIVSDVIQGKTPKDYSEPQNVSRMMIGSGAMGFLGDTVVRSVMESKDGKGAELSLFKSLFPTLGAAGGLAVTAGRSAKSFVDSKTQFPASDLADDLINTIPFQNLFYTKAAMHYYLFNAIREAANPGYLGRQERRAFDSGQEWWMFTPTDSNLWMN